MNLYTEFLVAFMLVFAVGYTLAYLPGMLKMKAIYKRNLLFLVSVGLVLQLGNGLKLSYLWAVGFIFMGHRTKRILRIERKEYQTY